MLAECGHRMCEEVRAEGAEDCDALDLLPRVLVSDEAKNVGSW